MRRLLLFAFAAIALQGCGGVYVVGPKAGCTGSRCGDLILEKSRRAELGPEAVQVDEDILLKSLEAAGYSGDVSRVRDRGLLPLGVLGGIGVFGFSMFILGDIAHKTFDKKSGDLDRALENSRLASAALGGGVLIWTTAIGLQGQPLSSLLKKFNERDMRRHPKLDIIKPELDE